jgi:hypothetical protein
MHKIIFILVFMMCFSFSKAQNYIQNIPFDTTLYSTSYAVNSSCTAAYQLRIQLSPSLFTYVSGMKFMVVIDSVYFPGPMSSSPVKPGDTTILNSSNPTFSTMAVSGLKYWCRIELSGTPAVPGQSYPCHLQISQCLCFCTDIMIQPSLTNTSVCSVNLNNSINELSDPKSISVFPNPSCGQIFIKNISASSDLSIYNNYGQLVITKHITGDVSFDISNLSEGVYWLFCTDENRKKTISKLAIVK